MTMTTTRPRPQTTTRPWALAPSLSALTVALAGLGATAPAAATGDMPTPPPSHYLAIVCASPWTALGLVVLPLALALAISAVKVASLSQHVTPWGLRICGHALGLAAGPVMAGVVAHLIRHVVGPLTFHGTWESALDVTTLSAAIAVAVPAAGLTLVELGLLGKCRADARAWHLVCTLGLLVAAPAPIVLAVLATALAA